MQLAHTHDEAEGDLPAFLCRRCHPEINTPATVRAALDAADRDKQIAADKLRVKQREVDTTKLKLASLTKRDPEPGSVSAKIMGSLSRKLLRLQAELRELTGA